MHRVAGTLMLATLAVGCKPTAAPAESPASPTERSTASTPAARAPIDVAVALPELSGSLPAVPEGALRLTVEDGRFRVGDVEVAERGALVQALAVAGAANRPVAIFVEASLRSSAVLEVLEAVQNSGANMIGLVARMDDGSLGWLPIRHTVVLGTWVPELSLEADQEDFAGLADAAWERQGHDHQLEVGVDETMRVQMLLTALHHLRGPQCAQEPGSCRFAALGLAPHRRYGGEEGKMGKPAPTSAAAYDRNGKPLGEGTIGLGNTGLIGKGGGGGSGSGYGRGAGAGFGGSGKRVPRVRQAKSQVVGPLDKDIIRRIVRAHINEVRHCYNQGLVKDPDLTGRVAVKFTIGATGKVGASKVDSTTLPDTDVASCVAKAVKRWNFPKPRGGGEVHVTYPFVLVPG